MPDLYIPVPEVIVKPDGRMTRELQLFLQKLVQALGSGTSRIRQATLTLANADILTSPSTFLEVVPTPGLGFYLLVHRWALTIDTSAGGYTNVDNTDANNGFTVAYGDWNAEGSTLVPLFADSFAGGNSFFGGPWVDVPSAAALAAVYPSYGIYFPFVPENLPLKLVAWNNSAGDFTGGDPANVGRLTVYYTVEPIF